MKLKETPIVKTVFGSQLYGTATAQSDTDYKGVFLPRRSDIILGRVPKSYNDMTKKNNGLKNSSSDIDTEFYSLHYFIKLALEGQTVAIDMLHAAPQHLLETSEIWEQIVSERHRFYTKSLKAFIGYARRQASKYGIKGSRLDAAKSIIDMLISIPSQTRLEMLWDKLPNGEHLHHIEPSPNSVRQYQVCGKKFQETQTAEYALSILTKFYTDYGKRAQQAAENKGIDWKAVSHAIRAAFQVKDLLTKKTITFPLEYAGLLLDIKAGKMDYTTEAAPLLDTLMDEVEALAAESSLPEKADHKFWENFIIRTVENYVL